MASIIPENGFPEEERLFSLDDNVQRAALKAVSGSFRALSEWARSREIDDLAYALEAAIHRYSYAAQARCRFEAMAAEPSEEADFKELKKAEFMMARTKFSYDEARRSWTAGSVFFIPLETVTLAEAFFTDTALRADRQIGEEESDGSATESFPSLDDQLPQIHFDAESGRLELYGYTRPDDPIAKLLTLQLDALNTFPRRWRATISSAMHRLWRVAQTTTTQSSIEAAQDSIDAQDNSADSDTAPVIDDGIPESP